jgi:integrase
MTGHVRRRGKGWCYVLELGRDPLTDKRRQQWRSGFKTKKDAQAALTQALQEVQTGTFADPGKLTVADYLERWLADYAAHQVGAVSQERYAHVIRTHLIPRLGRLPLGSLRPLHVQGYVTAALRSGRVDGKGGLSPVTVRHHYRVLSEALRQAVKWQLLARNPAEAVDPPRGGSASRPVEDASGVRRLLELAEGTPLQTPLWLAATVGLRRGEVLGLRWEDVDLPGAQLTVRQTLRPTSPDPTFGPPKNKRVRTIVLPPLAVEALRRHKAAQAEHRLRLGPAFHNHGLVCPAADGTPWNPRSFSNQWGRLVAKAGLPDLHFHDLRHTHASLLLQAGVNPKVVSERLGHSGVAITLDLYSHLLPGVAEDAAQRLERLLRDAEGA